MPSVSDGLTLADIAALRSAPYKNNQIYKVTNIDDTFSYPSAFYYFEEGAAYTEILPAIVQNLDETGYWIMFPTPLALSTGNPVSDAEIAGIEWINTSTGDRFVSNPDLSWSPVSGGSGSLTTLTTTGFTQPSIDSTVTINAVDSSTFVSGQYVTVETGGDYLITAVPSISQITIQNLGGTNANPATAIATGKKVTPTGKPQNNSFYVAGMHFESNATATTIAATNTPVKIAGTTTSNALNRSFTHTNNRLTYTGSISRLFMVTCSATFSSGNNHDLTAILYKNGIAISGGKNSVTTSSEGLASSISCQALVELSNADYIELWTENKTAIANITATELNLIIRAV